MAKFEISGRTYDLVMTVRAMAEIEKKWGDLQAAMEQFRSGGRNIEMVREMFRILANAGQHVNKLPEDVTGDELDDLGLGGLSRLSSALRTAMDESIQAETIRGGLADDEEYDIYAEELEKQQKNVKAGGGPGSVSITGTP
jgi:hypothetical protein